MNFYYDYDDDEVYLSLKKTIFIAVEIDEKKTVEVIQSNGISSLTPEPSEESKEIISKVSFIKEHKIIQESRIIKVSYLTFVPLQVRLGDDYL